MSIHRLTEPLIEHRVHDQIDKQANSPEIDPMDEFRNAQRPSNLALFVNSHNEDESLQMCRCLVIFVAKTKPMILHWDLVE